MYDPLRVEKLSRCHGSKISAYQNRDPANMAEKDETIDMYDFPVHDSPQEQNGSPHFSS